MGVSIKCFINYPKLLFTFVTWLENHQMVRSWQSIETLILQSSILGEIYGLGLQLLYAITFTTFYIGGLTLAA